MERIDTKRKVALVTGVTGQDGSYLVEFLLNKGYEVHGVVRRSSTSDRTRIDHLEKFQYGHNPTLFIHYADLSDSASLTDVLFKAKPDEVYNLGAQSHVHISFRVPEYTGDVTGVGVTRLLEAIRRCQEVCNKNIKFYQASSSELYGKVLETPQTEKTPFYPRSPYGVAKLYAFWITKN